MPALTPPIPKKSSTKLIVIGAVLLVLLLALGGGAFVYFALISSCGSATKTKEALTVPGSFKQIDERRIECNNIIESYPNKLVMVYDVSAAKPQDFEKLDQAIVSLGYQPTNNLDDGYSFVRRNQTVSVTYSRIQVNYGRRPPSKQGTGQPYPEAFTGDFDRSQTEVQYATIYFETE